MGKSTISIAFFTSKLFVYQQVTTLAQGHADHARQNRLGRSNRPSASGAGRHENPMVDGESPKLSDVAGI